MQLYHVFGRQSLQHAKRGFILGDYRKVLLDYDGFSESFHKPTSGLDGDLAVDVDFSKKLCSRYSKYHLAFLRSVTSQFLFS